MPSARRWPPDGPEAIVIAAFAALQRRDGHALAALASPASLAEYQSILQGQLRPHWHPWTAESLLQHQPDMPYEVAEWQLQQMAMRDARHQSHLLEEFPGARSIEDLEQATPTQLLSWALAGAHIGMTAFAECEVLGHVVDPSKPFAYVLYRLRYPTMQDDAEDSAGHASDEVMPEPNMAVVRRENGRWWFELDPFNRCGMPGFRNVSWSTSVEVEGEASEDAS